MKIKRIFIAMVIIVVFTLALTGCSNDIDYANEYKQIIYDVQEGKYMPTGNKILINEDYTFSEVFRTSNGEQSFSGNYVEDNKLDLLFMELNTSSLDSFKRNYRSELKKLGYTTSEIDNLIMPTIKGKGELYKYKDYFFKLSSIVAAREGDIATVNQLDGVYNSSTVIGGKDRRIKFELGQIFLAGIDEFGDEIFKEKIGEYEVGGDFITIKPTVALGGGSVNKPMRYLLADITLPAKYEEDVDDNNRFNGNDVITVYKNVKIKVIVGSFYTTKDTK